MEEILYVVDGEDKFVRKTTRKEVMENALLHRCSRIIIHNDNNLFLVQKRSMEKDIYPGCWDIGVAGTVNESESYESTAIRELMEEVGITGVSNIQLMHSFLFKLKYTSKLSNTHCKVYELIYNGAIKPQKEEIDEVKLLETAKVKKLMETKKFHPIGKAVFEKYLELKNIG